MASNDWKQALISPTNSWALSFSDILVKPLKSVNRIVTCSKFLASARPFSLSSSATSEGRIFSSSLSERSFSFSIAFFAFLIYNGYRNDDLFQMIFFSVVEATFYQYSIMSAIRNVYEYNKQDNFFKRIKLSLSTTF